MSTPEPGGLVARLRQMGRGQPEPEQPPSADQAEPDPGRMRALERRVAHLEELIEGLQDSVYREAQRESRRITELEARLEPAEIAAALSKDARERGL